VPSYWKRLSEEIGDTVEVRKMHVEELPLLNPIANLAQWKCMSNDLVDIFWLTEELEMPTVDSTVSRYMLLALIVR
jgi:hypothetical protein